MCVPILFSRAAQTLALQHCDAWQVRMRTCCLMRTPHQSIATADKVLPIFVPSFTENLFTSWRDSFDNLNFESWRDSSVNPLIVTVTSRIYSQVLKSGFDWLSDLAANQNPEAQVVYGRQNIKVDSKHTYYWGLALSWPSHDVALLTQLWYRSLLFRTKLASEESESEESFGPFGQQCAHRHREEMSPVRV